MRAAIYARFSSALQDARSITDQVTMARRYAETRGLQVTAVHEDAGISGASIINRPGPYCSVRAAQHDTTRTLKAILCGRHSDDRGQLVRTGR